MGNNLPRMSARDRRNAPWNQPDPADRLPVYCSECGFKAETLEQMSDHEHDDSEFRENPNEPQKKCAVCCPPSDIAMRPINESDLPFCDSHDLQDYADKLKAEEEALKDADISERR